MKASVSILSLLAVSTVLASGCSQPVAPAPLPLPIPIPAPAVDVGPDSWVPMPLASRTLRGFVKGQESLYSWAWKKVSGPDSYVIESPQSRVTNVTNLALGTYEFELAVTNRDAQTGRDKVLVHVYEPRVAANELIFRNLTWECPFNCAAYIDNLPLYMPGTPPLSVFLRQGSDGPWIEVKPEAQLTAGDKFSYAIRNDALWLEGWEDLRQVDVRILFSPSR